MKIKLYIDTNMIHDLFTRQAKSIRTGKKLEEPKKFAFMLDHMDKFEFITSFLTKAEVMRELVSGHGVDVHRVEQFWTAFTKALKPKYIPKFEFDEQIVDIVSKAPTKKNTMVNFFHLFIAIREKAYFVSGDKPILDKTKELELYDKLLTYVELQKLANDLTRHRHEES